ncbi:hypothetical protein [Myroides sp. C4067]|uniref:hypothetical protein n=1 Tax=Myroides sp. C4067 TaxID=3136765 RepID=UPI003101901A
MKEISEEQLYSYFLETLNCCGTFLLDRNDDEIEYLIFEVFDINVRTFFYCDTLIKLLTNKRISIETYEKAERVRCLYLSTEGTDLWSINGIRESDIWKEIFNLCDDIRKDKIIKE